VGANLVQIVENKVANQKMGIKYVQNLLVKGFIAALQGQTQLDIIEIEIEIQLITRNVEGFVREKQNKLRVQSF
jgi:FKBP-type peptidyl-prolyl cis-trans isomerase FkpA